MKKLFFSFFVLMISISLAARSQEKNLEGIATIRIPNQTSELNSKNLRSMSTSTGRKKNPLIGDPKKTTLYKIGDILLTISVFSSSSNKKDLATFKKNLDGLNSLAPESYTSTLRVVNGVQVLTSHRNIEGEGIYTVFTANRTGTSTLNITIDYPKTKSEEAKKLLSELIESIRFTNN